MKIDSLGRLAAGVALVALGCSDPVPPPAQGSLSVSVGPPFAGGACPSTGFNQKISLGDGPDHRKNDPGDRVIDGQDGASASCRVVGGGTSFNFSGSLERLSNAFTVTGTVTKGGTGTGQSSMFFPDVADVITSSEPCNIKVDTAPLEVAPGRIWGTIECPTMAVADRPGGASCGARGEFVLENCEQ
jgi:hypothetical protein